MSRLLFGVLSQGEFTVGQGILEQGFRRSAEAAGSARKLLREGLSNQRERYTVLAKLGSEVIALGNSANDFERSLAYFRHAARARERLETVDYRAESRIGHSRRASVRLAVVDSVGSRLAGA
jgi:hypothetical protein